MLELWQRFRPPPPPAVEPPTIELVVTLAHILACLALFVCARVLRTLSQLHAAERAHAHAVQRRRATAAAALAHGAGGALCWSESACEAGSETTSGTASSPTPAESDVDPTAPRAEQPGVLSRELSLRERPVVELAFLRRIASKSPPWALGPNVDELIARHHGAIARVLAACEGAPGFRPGRGAGYHDEIFALRFLLSHKMVAEKAAAAMRTTVEWRLRNRVDEIRAFVRSAPQDAFPGHGAIGRFFPTPIEIPAGDWPPFMLIEAARLDPTELMRHISIADYVVYSMHMSEKMAAACDEITHRTRHLTKAVRIVAMGGLRLKHASMGFARAASAAAQDHVDCYPQNLGNLFLCNVPYAMKAVWDSAVSPLLPERVVEKTGVLNPKLHLSDLDTLTDHVQLAHIPHCIYPQGGARM